MNVHKYDVLVSSLRETVKLKIFFALLVFNFSDFTGQLKLVYIFLQKMPVLVLGIYLLRPSLQRILFMCIFLNTYYAYISPHPSLKQFLNTTLTPENLYDMIPYYEYIGQVDG